MPSVPSISNAMRRLSSTSRKCASDKGDNFDNTSTGGSAAATTLPPVTSARNRGRSSTSGFLRKLFSQGEKMTNGVSKQCSKTGRTSSVSTRCTNSRPMSPASSCSSPSSIGTSNGSPRLSEDESLLILPEAAMDRLADHYLGAQRRYKASEQYDINYFGRERRAETH
eukprot:TRINITY_DN81218_c0_g1_i1.p1 TRINITY_DN81218_c0_g1~~TRINITY_DN81218_c0_g1_i1.p1  ORF type:complete len:168 (+),score=22.75 TRINITY_DN81218_c0_g1_i1:106-609(+)